MQTDLDFITILSMVSSKTNLHSGPNHDDSLSQKLVFKAKIEWGVGPRGGLEGQTPQDSVIFFHLRG